MDNLPSLEIEAVINHEGKDYPVRVYAIGNKKIEEYKAAQEGDIIRLK